MARSKARKVKVNKNRKVKEKEEQLLTPKGTNQTLLSSTILNIKDYVPEVQINTASV